MFCNMHSSRIKRYNIPIFRHKKCNNNRLNLRWNTLLKNILILINSVGGREEMSMIVN